MPRKFALLFLFPVFFCQQFFLPGHASGAQFEFSTIKPLAPYGAYAAFSARSLEKGRALVGVSVEHTREPDSFTYTLGAAYGITDRFEITLSIPYFDGLDGASSGIEDLGLAAKYRFIDEGRYGPSAAVLLIGYLGTGEDELSRDGAVGGGVLVSKKLGPFMAHLNGLWVTPRKDELDNEWDFVTALELAAAHSMKVIGEFEVKKSHLSEQTDLSEARLAYRIFTERFFSTLGAGYDFKNRTPEYRFFLTISAMLGTRR